METTIVYRGYTGIMEKKMETTMIHEYVIFRISRSLHWAAIEELAYISSTRKPHGLLYLYIYIKCVNKYSLYKKKINKYIYI